MKNLLNKNCTILLLLITLFSQVVKAQTTYTVTATTEDGPGSIIEAIQKANATPGTDIIEFTPGLQVNAATRVNPNFPFMLDIAESVVIDGKGGALNGFQHWISSTGVINGTTFCPGSDNGNTEILAEMPGLLNVGIKGQDNSGIEVTIKNLDVKQFNELARIREYASLIVENVKAKEIFSAYECKTTPMFFADEGASLTLRNSEFTESESWGEDAISGVNAEDLIIENCLFYDLNKRQHFAVNWNGQTSSKIHIVSSRFMAVGGINISGDIDIFNFVNSTWVNGSYEEPRFGDRFINNSTGSMNIISSSIRWNSNTCNAQCEFNPYPGLIESKKGQINFIESAIGFNFNDYTTFDNIRTLRITEIDAKGFTADEYTYIEPTNISSENGLKQITGQQNLITTGTAFNPKVINTPLDLDLVQPAISGVLIDKINYPVGNPITNTAITKDAIGNDRFDTNGFRDIGAIQLSLAPFLKLEQVVGQSVDLSWNEPLHHDKFPIARYEISYSEKGSSTPKTVDIDKNELTKTIVDLSYSQTYEFKVRAVYDDNGTEVVGPFSNIVDVPILAPFNIEPKLTAIPGDGEVNVTWTLPDLGGRTFERYVLFYRIGGTTKIIGGPGSINDSNQTNYLATDLTNEIPYEFILKVKASGEWSAEVLETTTPSFTYGIDDKILYYPNPVNDYLQINVKESFKVKMFSANGRLILNLINNKKIDISNLQSGLYIIQIQVNDKLYFGKILKD
ncbi:fibronectin type III domain-containing protein [Tenacibaculum ascidiaceicola]|uniref:fibronectin type III domain-containing protein n=1 Tax=Tenacibaculum ascidiaceicola TaxID=1699411 RepID=UPI0038944399